VRDVRRRLFDWRAESRRVAQEAPADAATMTHLTGDGTPVRWVPIPNRQAISRSDNDHPMGIFADGYNPHQYDQWLLGTVGNILDDDLSISSAGLLREGAVAWVEVSVPDAITTPEGVTFRPNLLATTSFDGSIATTFKRTVTDTVCDNTRAVALAETGQTFRVKHSRHSQLRLADARDALAMVYSVADEFAAEVKQLCATMVTDRQWQAFLDAHVPQVDPQGHPLEGRAATGARLKRAVLGDLYRTDDRCAAPWTGTAHGVVAAVNTFEHHEAAVRGTTRAERNMIRAVTGEYTALDRASWHTLSGVLAAG